ncbi:hypothetical protein [Amycolatopsis albispora]|nr:hypothetical protein [Amycolatopsis albispora]
MSGAVRYNVIGHPGVGYLGGQGPDTETGLIVMNAKKLLTFAGIALVLFFVIAQPQGAAGLVTNIITFLRESAESVITFVSNVFS